MNVLSNSIQSLLGRKGIIGLLGLEPMDVSLLNKIIEAQPYIMTVVWELWTDLPGSHLYVGLVKKLQP